MAESSAMTLLERDHYLDRVPGGYVNLTHGYPRRRVTTRR
jgi:hypothetical protein